MSLAIARISGEALAAAATETLIQVVTGSTREARIKEWSVSFNGVDSTDEPILVELLRQTTAGTSSALTMVKNNPSDPAIIATALQDFSAEPTAGDVLWSEYITPAGGFDRVQLPLGEEIVVAVSSRIGLRCTTAAGVTASAAAYIKFEE